MHRAICFYHYSQQIISDIFTTVSLDPTHSQMVTYFFGKNIRRKSKTGKTILKAFFVESKDYLAFWLANGIGL
jgi:hypothetical protein